MTSAVPAARLGAIVVAGRLVLAAMVVPLWLGLSLLPGTTPTFRVIGSVALAVLVGVGAELAARPPAPTGWRASSATLWIVPAGLVLVAIGWFSSPVPRPPAAPALGALAIVGAVLVQTLELESVSRARAAAHGVSTGLALLIGAVAFYLAIPLPGPLALTVVALTGIAVALVVLRAPSTTLRSTLLPAAVTALLAVEAAAMVLALALSVAAGAALLTLALYAACVGAQLVAARGSGPITIAPLQMDVDAALESRTVEGSGYDGDVPV